MVRERNVKYNATCSVENDVSFPEFLVALRKAPDAHFEGLELSATISARPLLRLIDHALEGYRLYEFMSILRP